MLVYRHIANKVATSCATEISTKMCKYRQGKTTMNTIFKQMANNVSMARHG
jgi:hypothetical protein